jgi:hypothetical protein
MNTTTKVILGILAALAGLWLVGKVIAIVNFLLPVIVVAGIGYVVYKFSTAKGLPGSTRKPLP